MYTIQESSIQPAGNGSYAFSVVLRHDPCNRITPFVVHQKVQPENDVFFNSGDYCRTLKQAVESYYARCHRYNLNPEGGTK